jgi:hypothetical protein
MPTSPNNGSLTKSVPMRVVPDGKPEFESTIRMWAGGDLDRLPPPGRQTYVLYDPAHPEHCQIDHDRLLKEFGPRYDGKPNMAIPHEPTDGQQPVSWTSASVATPAPEHEPDDVVGGLAKLSEMHANGTLTDSEFAEAKTRLLNPS